MRTSDTLKVNVIPWLVLVRRLAANGTTWGHPPMRFDDLDRWRSYLDDFAAAGFDGIEHMPAIAPVVETGAFADLTEGNVDFERLRDALNGRGYKGWATVEMERRLGMPGQPVDLARNAITYLHDLGYGSG